MPQTETPPPPLFQSALLTIAELLADARYLEQRGRGERAHAVYALAEARALRSGFLELAHLVWSYCPPFARRNHG